VCSSDLARRLYPPDSVHAATNAFADLSKAGLRHRTAQTERLRAVPTLVSKLLRARDADAPPQLRESIRPGDFASKHVYSPGPAPAELQQPVSILVAFALAVVQPAVVSASSGPVAARLQRPRARAFAGTPCRGTSRVATQPANAPRRARRTARTVAPGNQEVVNGGIV